MKPRSVASKEWSNPPEARLLNPEAHSAWGHPHLTSPQLASPRLARQGALGLPFPDGLGCPMKGRLQITHQPLQSFALASGGRQVIGDHAGMAEIQQETCLLGGEAEKVLVVVVDDFHQVR